MLSLFVGLKSAPATSKRCAMSHFENKTIVVPFDFSEPSTRAIDMAIELGGQAAKLHLIHVVVPIPTLISLDSGMPVPISYDKELVDDAVNHMKELFEHGKYSQFERHCVIGDPGSEIVNLAKSVQADLIVIPSHGRTGLKRLFLGSVAERVLRLSECPVLVLRDKH
jgi:nucleotide-binding universal stress UspA family protein